MSRGTGGLALAGLSFPRVSGDEPFPRLMVSIKVGFSPRERG